MTTEQRQIGLRERYMREANGATWIDWLEDRVLELTADEAPRQAAERIADEKWFPLGCSRQQLIEAVTTAIQAASNAQLERGRKSRAEIETWLLGAYSNAFPHYEWTDAQSAIDLMLAEITTLRHELSQMDHTAHVAQFMAKFGQHIGEAPGFPPQEVLDLRIRLMAEEFAELLEAAGYPYVVRVCRRGGGLWDGDGPALFDKEAFDSHTADFPAFIRELLDLEKTVLGTHIACGVDPAEPWARVCAANMAKEMRGGQPVKPSGWQAPDIAGALREQGWQGGAE